MADDDPFAQGGTPPPGDYDPFRPEGALDSSAKHVDEDAEAFGAMAAEGSEGASQRSASEAGGSNPLGRPPSKRHSDATGQSGSQVGSRRESGIDSMRKPPLQRKPSEGGIGVNSGTFRGKSFARNGTMMRNASMADAAHSGTFVKKATMASMMLSGGDPDEIVAAGPDDDGIEYVDDDEFGGGEGGFATADRMEAEQIFMPNLKREAYIPVRIARDKVKMVLSQMAQLKSMHYQALETMEKQQGYLKAQLEASVAQYVRKLTKDYNDRVNALEAEYKRRLQNLNVDALSGLKTTIERSKQEAAGAEHLAEEKVRQKDAELASERKLFQARMEQEKKLAQAAHEEAARAKIDLERAQQEIEQLRAQLGGDGGGNGLAQAHQRIAELERENEDLRSELQALTGDDE